MQPLILEAATKPSAIFENVAVDPQTGKVDFGAPGPGGTTNQRGIMKRQDLVLDGKRHFTQEPNIPSITELDEINIIFITRQNTIIPPISKLNLEQAAAFFMLGESVHSSASTQKKELWGKPVNEVGTNPFIVGSLSQEGNLFYQLLKNLPQEKLNIYLVNTGMVGENSGREGLEPQDITVLDTTTILRQALRGNIEWVEDPVFGLLLPKEVPELEDWSRFDIFRYYTKGEILQMAGEKYIQRMEWLSQFEGLDSAILNALRPPQP
jgi:phosphoenolpyruvate carboxykinase (ATP)